MRAKVYLTPADHGRPLTWDEFASADAQEGFRYEMIEGRVEVSPVPNLPHDRVLNRILAALIFYSERHKDILPYISTRGCVFVPDPPEGITVPEPDLSGYTEFFPEGTPVAAQDWRSISPAFVVEVLSPDTEDKDLERNRRLYVQVPSIREYWIVDPRAAAGEPMLLLYRRRGRRWAARLTFAAGETYTTPLLPGFSLLLDPLA
jgi:Uma2 family endonuclease